MPRQSFATKATKSPDAMDFDRPLYSQDFSRYLSSFAQEFHDIGLLDQIDGIRLAGLDALGARC